MDADVRGEALALLHDGRSWTRAQWLAATSARADALAAAGVRPDQVVLVPDAPALDLVWMQAALDRLGAALLPHRAGLDSDARRALAERTGAEWQWGGAGTGIQPLAAHRAPARPTVPDDPDRLALLVRTSGSTGEPKVVMLTAGALQAAARASNERLRLGPGDLWLCCLRLSHIGGLAIPMRCTLAGAGLLLHDGFAAEAVLRDLRAHPVTHLSLVPPMLARLLDLDPTPPPTLRVALIGGQAVSRTLARRALDAGWPLHLSYAMSETASQIAILGPLSGMTPEPGLAGTPLAGFELDCPPCEAPPARLRVRGAALMAGYANPGRVPGQGLDADGWFETADLACRAPDGALYILGRADDLLVIGGIQVARARVESVLRDLPGVDDLVVVDQADPVWGRRLIAVYSGPGDPAVLERQAAARLAPTERPREYRRLDRLPLLDAGKYDRVAIAAMCS